MKSTALTLSLATALVLSLGACSKQDAPTTPAAATTTVAAISSSSYDKVAATGKGFTVGALMSAQAVYVLFDPQCPHCGHLWQSSIPLHSKVKFIWVPIAFNTGKSLSQAAALLSAANPAETMTAHEQSLLAGTGGMAASSPSDELVQTIKSNTQLLSSLGADSVPFIVAKNRRTGEIVSNNGAMDTDALAKLLGVD
ncbi:MAG: thioredoxin fold domain-containing protein [Rhodoferax sp.]|uniref:thioredoxin fold domain-containing protein n=1 Tax=Rhodoferax sp. TaxID=50421 RepID=UPI002625E7B0|nr:thioredoxin fold domain-containing protein [Rhodoferax sp.]MDD2880316.1 thioredoxin fold domain-containing protein [Rhodoferax sp.]